MQYRNTFGTTATIANTIALPGGPVYLQIQRQGDVLTAATSTDGVNYHLVPGATETVVMPYASLAGLALSSGASGTSVSASFDTFSVGGITSEPSDTPSDTPSAQACPAGWNCGDVGDPLEVGGQTLSGTDWTFTGAGSGFGNGGMTDQFHYVWTTASGDTTLSTHITSQTDTNGGATAGVMFRSGTGANAGYYGAFITPGNGLEVLERTGQGIPTVVLASQSGTTPAYLRIARSADVFSAYTSTDGVNWTPVVGGTDTISALSGAVLEGLAMSSAVAATTGTVAADVLSVTGSAPAPPTVCPSGWTCADVGSPIPPGSNYLINGQWSILGGGSDMWGSADQLHYTAETLPGDGTVNAQIVSQQDTDAWAKSGIMLRATTDPGSPYFAILSTGGNGTIIQYRTTQGGSTSQITGVTSGTPIYVEVARSGTTFTAYTSTDGGSWTAYPGGSVSIPAMTGSLLAGMADTSHSQFGTSTTVFAGFTVTSAGSSLPVPWSDSDVGSPAVAGSASYSGGVFTVNGAGADVWASTDQFNYVSQPLACYNREYDEGIYDYLTSPGVQAQLTLAGPGRYIDPDMLEVGTAAESGGKSLTGYALTRAEAATNFAHGDVPVTDAGLDVQAAAHATAMYVLSSRLSMFPYWTRTGLYRQFPARRESPLCQSEAPLYCSTGSPMASALKCSSRTWADLSGQRKTLGHGRYLRVNMKLMKILATPHFGSLRRRWDPRRPPGRW